MPSPTTVKRLIEALASAGGVTTEQLNTALADYTLTTVLNGFTAKRRPIDWTRLRRWVAGQSIGLDPVIGTSSPAGTGTNLAVRDQNGGAAPYTLETTDRENASAAHSVAWHLRLPEDYEAGGNLLIHVGALMSRAANVSATFDVEAYLDNDGSDLCGTAAFDCNNVSQQTEDFVISGITLNPGDNLLLRLRLDIDDTGGSGAIYGICDLLEYTYTARDFRNVPAS